MIAGRMVVLAAFSVVLTAGYARGWNANEVDFPGEGTGWADPSTLNATAKYTGPDGRTEWFRYTLVATSNNPDFDFKMTVGNTFANDYGGNLNFAKNALGTMFWNPLNDDPSKLLGGVSNGFRYVFTAYDPPLGGTTNISVMELSADPAFISSVNGPFGSIDSNEVITISVNFFSNLPPEQKVYARFTTNNFASSTLIQGAVVSNAATILYTNRTGARATTKWYVLSSTAPASYLQSQSSYGIDALTLTWGNNGGSNYLFVTNPREPDFLFHNNNRVILQGSNVQFWVKIGFANSDGSGRWASNACVYYTTDGSAPAGSYGVPSGNTQVAPMTFNNIEWDAYEGGDAMWWAGTAQGLPGYTPIKYRIGAWYDTTKPERFADYNAGTNNQTFTFQLGVFGEPDLNVNGVPANYTTSKFFIDEIAGETQKVTVIYRPGVANPDKVEVFSNLDRRDYVDADVDGNGIPDGMRAPDGNLVSPATTGAYFRAHTMTQFAPGEFVWTGIVSRCGAYRLTARHTVAGNTNWTYYTTSGRRDHAIVVSPRKVLDQTMYELNTLTVEAQGADQNGRSTFVDLLSAAQGDSDGYDHFSLEYLNFLQVNCIWFQPIHPNGFERSENDPVTGQPYAPGSPYATKNYFAVGAPFGTFYNEGNAMDEFTNFVHQADAHTGSVGTINVMLDGVFNHSSWDAVFGQGAPDLGFRRAIGDINSPLIAAGDRIGWYRPYWYSDSQVSYCDEADYYNSAFDNDFAVAPDRGDFGKWNDVADLYFGRYSALVCLNPQDNGSYLNEADYFDIGSQTPGVQELWKLFAYYPEFWLKKTGHSGTNSFVQSLDDRGIDGLRCDFGQGMPPQFWEYVINRTRKAKWNFLYMAETLDGGVPGYRSNRHFDILNENLVFQFTQAKINNAWELRSGLESRRNGYSGSAILLNLTSHDEILPDDDPWVTFSRYGAVSAVDGIPMIFFGQEQGIKNYQSNPAFGWDDGFIHHELNFGKYVPHFKRWNQLTVWFNDPPFSAGLDLNYARVNFARHYSPALRSQNRYFLSRMAGGDNAKIFAVAKYEQPFASPRNKDVVLAFVNFLNTSASGPHLLAADSYDLRPAWSLLGLDTNRQYKARNLAAANADAILPGWPKTGVDLWNSGVFVSLDGGQFGPIADSGALVQYLKIEEELDFDQDGLPVDYELAYGLSPTDGTGPNGAAGDPDGDRMANWQEYVAGTNPNDDQSLPIVNDFAQSSGPSRQIVVPTVSGRWYHIYYADGGFSNGMAWSRFGNTNLGVGSWYETSASPTTHAFVDDESTNSTFGPPSDGVRHYRVNTIKP